MSIVLGYRKRYCVKKKLLNIFLKRGKHTISIDMFIIARNRIFFFSLKYYETINRVTLGKN